MIRGIPLLPAAALLGAGLVGVIAAPAQAQTQCANVNFVRDLKTQGFSCISGDKTYSSFSNIVGLADDDQVQISDGVSNHTIAFSNANGWSAGTYGAKYRVTVNSGNNYLLGYAASSSSSVFAPVLPAGSVSVSATPGSSAGTVNGGLTPPKFYSNQTTTSDEFVAQLTVSQGLVTSFDNTLTQGTPAPKDTVPGPLPILGAASAFGFSRKLRRRVAQAAA